MLHRLSILVSRLDAEIMDSAMSDPAPQTKPESEKPSYTWPWFVLAAFLLAVLLAVLWMSSEVRRMRQIRELNAPAPTSQLSNSLPVGR
jgi:hypothetical protein